jgi:hypothetical protein
MTNLPEANNILKNKLKMLKKMMIVRVFKIIFDMVNTIFSWIYLSFLA